MTEQPPYRYGFRMEPDENLSARVPQVAVRARLYRLEGDGASDLARRKRPAKGRDLIGEPQSAIAAIERRQAGNTYSDPYPEAIAAKRVAAH
jgi:hypothetical protein